jgi:NADH:ubiquinone reductase (H+-translocating)
LDTLGCAKQRGRVKVDRYLELLECPGVWAIGDCAAIPDESTGGFYPPTAQHALRQGKILARNIAATILGKPKRAFRFTTIGQLAAIGRRTGVARIYGIKFSGFFAWWLWRTIYWAKLPRFEKKLRVALDWTLDLAFSKDLTQLKPARPIARMVSDTKPTTVTPLNQTAAA